MTISEGTRVPAYRRLPRVPRRRKSAPVWLRLQRYLSAWAHRWGGRWKACPSYAKLAGYLGVCVDSISRAFRFLEQSAFCPLAFRSGFTGKNGTRQKLFALRSWLKYDGEPLLYRKDGRSRGIRVSFRRGAKVVHSAVSPERRGNSDLRPRHSKRRLASADKPEPAPAGLSRLDWYRSLPADFDPAKLPPPVETRTPNALAWRRAREALTDGALFYDNSKAVMPVASLRALLLPAFERGLSWERTIRPALKHALQEAHNAAVLGEVRNPGGFAAVILRERLGLAEGKTRHRRRRQTNGSPAPAPKIRDFPVSPPPPAASPVDRAAARAQALTLAAMMRGALQGQVSSSFPAPPARI